MMMREEQRATVRTEKFSCDKILSENMHKSVFHERESFISALLLLIPSPLYTYLLLSSLIFSPPLLPHVPSLFSWGL